MKREGVGFEEHSFVMSATFLDKAVEIHENWRT